MIFNTTIVTMQKNNQRIRTCSYIFRYILQHNRLIKRYRFIGNATFFVTNVNILFTFYIYFKLKDVTNDEDKYKR